MNDANERTANPLGDEFDRMMRTLTGLPDVVQTTPSTIPTLTPVINLAQTWIVQTYRHRDQGDIIFLQYISASGSMRVVVPPSVADAISRQRDSLSKKNRKKGARQAVETKRAMGIDPAAQLREYTKAKNARRKGRKAK